MAEVQKDPNSSESCSEDDACNEHLNSLTIWDLIQQNYQSAAVRRVKKGLVSATEVKPSNGWTLLHCAAYYGAERTASQLLKAGANVHAVATNNETALHLAAKWPHEKVVEVLLKAGANPNALNKRGRSPAHTAALFSRRGALELIINAGGDVSLQDLEGNTPLHVAARPSGPGPNEVVRTLLRAKCRVDLPNLKGELPLASIQNLQGLVVFAAMESLPDLMALLIKQGGVKLDVFDVSGMTPLQTAAFKGDMNMARILLGGGAKVNFQATPSWTPCPSLLSTDASLTLNVGGSSNQSTKPLGDRSPLHFAAERGAVPMMELLISAGAKVNNVANEGLISPLHIAVWNQQAEAVRVLLAHKADVKARVNKNGMAPLHFACNAREAKLEIISMLLDAKADIEERCSDGLTPLMLAAQMATPDAVRLLLVRGARVQAKGRRGMTAVDCAEGRADILQVLAQHCMARGLTEMANKANTAAQRAARLGKANAQLALPAADGSTSSHGDGNGALVPSENGSSSLAVDNNGSAGGAGLVDQLKQQLNTTSARLYAWAAATNGRVGGDVANGSTGVGAQMGVPSSLADIGTSPLAYTSPQDQAPLANGPQLSNALRAGNNISVLSEAVQMLSTITAMVTNRGDVAAPTRTRKGTGRRGTVPSATITELDSDSQASSSGPPVGLCSAGVSHCLASGLSSCTCTASSAVLLPTEHQLHLTCTNTCVLTFHLSCWKAVRDKLRSLRPSFPASFSQATEPLQCCSRDCRGTIKQVSMMGPAGAQIVYQWSGQTIPEKPCTPGFAVSTLAAAAATSSPVTLPGTELVLRPAPTPATLTAVSPLTQMSPLVHQYTFIAERAATPPPAPAPTLLTATLLPPTAPTSTAISDSGAAPVDQHAAEAHGMRRKRRTTRDVSPAGPDAPLLHASGEMLQGRNPPAEVSSGNGDPLAQLRSFAANSGLSWDDALSTLQASLPAGHATLHSTLAATLADR